MSARRQRQMCIRDSTHTDTHTHTYTHTHIYIHTLGTVIRLGTTVVILVTVVLVLAVVRRGNFQVLVRTYVPMGTVKSFY